MISTHVLDLGSGQPAAGIAVTLLRKEDKIWKDIASGRTNGDGRCSFDCGMDTGIYQLLFDVENYLRKKEGTFYSSIPVVFRVEDAKQKLHIPLLLSPFGYSTYRGS